MPVSFHVVDSFMEFYFLFLFSDCLNLFFFFQPGVINNVRFEISLVWILVPGYLLMNQLSTGTSLTLGASVSPSANRNPTKLQGFP